MYPPTCTMNITLQLKRGVQNFATNWGVHVQTACTIHESVSESACITDSHWHVALHGG